MEIFISKANVNSHNIITDITIYNYQPTINMCIMNTEEIWSISTYLLYIVSILSIQPFVVNTICIGITESLHVI